MMIAGSIRPPGDNHGWAKGAQPIGWALHAMQAIPATAWRLSSRRSQIAAPTSCLALTSPRVGAFPRNRTPIAPSGQPTAATQAADEPRRRAASRADAATNATSASSERAARSLPADQIEQFEAFFRRYDREVFGYIWRLMGDEQTAYDLSQEVFLRAWRNFARVQRYEQPRAWLLRVATNLVINHRQRATLAARHSAYVEQLDTLSGGAPDPATQFAERDAVRETLLAIPARQRITLALRVVYGYSFDEIASTLGITLAAAKMTLSRARQRFRDHYLRQHPSEE